MITFKTLYTLLIGVFLTLLVEHGFPVAQAEESRAMRDDIHAIAYDIDRIRIAIEKGCR